MRNLLVVAILLSGYYSVRSQGNIQSPYAQFGLGIHEPVGNARSMALGYTGVASTNTLHINMINPALTAYSRKYVIYEAGGFGQMSWLSTQTQGQFLFGGSLQYINLLFPVGTRNWTLGAGMNPYTSANARYTSYGQVQNGGFSTYITERNVVDGALNQVYITNAFKLPLGFSIGLNASFIFGSIARQKYIYPEGIASNIIPRHFSNELYRVMEFKPGAAYNRALGKGFELGIGATYTLSADLDSRRELTNSIFWAPGRGSYSYDIEPLFVYNDTFSLPTKPVVLPSQFQAGASINYKGKISLNVDYTLTDYSNYRDLTGKNTIFNTSHRYAVSTEWIPKSDALRGIYKRMSYRFGGYYFQTPFEFQNIKITEMGATFGFGLPLGRSKASSLNVALMYGIRGTVQSNLVEERFFRFSVGMNLNDMWFIKYRMD